jgi:hypothetical protein
VEIVRLGGRGPGGGGGGGATAPRVYAPRFPKLKEEGWWLVLGDAASRELMALRRVSFGGRGTTVRLAFPRRGAGECSRRGRAGSMSAWGRGPAAVLRPRISLGACSCCSRCFSGGKP